MPSQIDNIIAGATTLHLKFDSVHPEIVDFGSWQGPNIFKTAGIAGYSEDFKNVRTPPGTKRCYFRMGTR